jgi:hypothetical protein
MFNVGVIFAKVVSILLQGSQHIDISLDFDSQDIHLWIKKKITKF